MAIRCFARRFLVGPYRANGTRNFGFSQSIRSLTTESVRHNDQHLEVKQSEGGIRDNKNAGISIRSSENGKNPLDNFFSPRWIGEKRFKNIEDSTPSQTKAGSSSEDRNAFTEQTSPGDEIIDHPLVQDLKRELQSHEAKPSPELVWRLYSAIQLARESNIQVRHSSEESSSTNIAQQGSLNLPYFAHMRVLRIIRPPRTDASGWPRHPTSIEIQQYIDRISKVFQNLSYLDPINFPSSNHYDMVLHHIAKSGNVALLFALWSAMTGTSFDDGKNIRRARQRKMAETITGQEFKLSEPSKYAYESMLYGISTHLQDQLRRAYKKDINDGTVQGFGDHRRERMDAVYGSDSQDRVRRPRKQEQLSAQARQALLLASQRTSDLLRDMLKREIPLSKFACNTAMKVMRMTGNLTALKALTKLSFGVDLDNLDVTFPLDGSKQEDVPTSFVGKPDVQTLNTVIMALGEQSTVGKMVSAYETLTHPLPKAVKIAQDKMPEGSLFATDFRGLFGTKSSEAENAAEQAEEVDVKDDFNSLEITPNTQTMKLLIQFACKSPSPWQVMMRQINQTPDYKREQLKEYEARERGHYATLAQYFVRDTVSRQEESLRQLAKRFGIEEEEITHLIKFFTNELSHLAKPNSTGIPKTDEDESNFASHYFNCVSYLTKGGMKEAEDILSGIPKPQLMSEVEMERLSEGERDQLNSMNERAMKNHQIQQESAKLFIDRAKGISEAIAKTFTLNEDSQLSYKSSTIDLTPEVITPLINRAKQARNIALIRDLGNWIERSMALYLVKARILDGIYGHWDGIVQQQKRESAENFSLNNSLLRIANRIEMVNDKNIIDLSTLYVQGIRRYILQSSSKRKERVVRRKSSRASRRDIDLLLAKEQDKVQAEKIERKKKAAKEREEAKATKILQPST